MWFCAFLAGCANEKDRSAKQQLQVSDSSVCYSSTKDEKQQERPVLLEPQFGRKKKKKNQTAVNIS